MDTDQCTHGGCVVYRKAEDGAQFLLVSPKRGPGAEATREWLLPKGHLRPGELPGETALREAEEEAGILGEVVDDLDTKEFATPRGNVRARYFLVKFRHQIVPTEGQRDMVWLSGSEALGHTPFPEVKDLLRLAQRRLSSSEGNPAN